MLGIVETNPFAMAVKADSPYKTFTDLAAAIKGDERLTYSSAGVGAPQCMQEKLLLSIGMYDTANEFHADIPTLSTDDGLPC